ncbi:MAG: hypothetical protein Kow0025_20220 [Thermodesulfovibrionales bacterium]
MKLPEKQIRYIDLPEVSETFSDSLRLATFDGQSLRIEFCVTRYDEPSHPNPQTARRYPVCRIVLTPEAAGDLLEQLYKLNEAISKETRVRGILASLSLAPTEIPLRGQTQKV